MKCSAVIAALLLATVASTASAQDRGFATLSNDNDFWAFRHQDQDYSNGLELDLRFPLAPAWGFDRVLAGAAIGQAFFTPPNLKETDPSVLLLDRPYAGWTWTAARVEGFTRRGRVGIEARAGVLGPHAFGEQVQIAWHSWNLAPRPLGWPVSQVRDTPDVGLGAWSSFDVLRFRFAGATVEGACDLGTIRVACRAAAFARVGYLRDDRAAAPRLDTPVAPPFSNAHGARPFELFVFAGAAARVVARDEVLEGDVQMLNGAWAAGWSERRSVGGEVHVGAAATWRGWSLSFTEIVRSSEARKPVAADRRQHFGRVVLGYAW